MRSKPVAAEARGLVVVVGYVGRGTTTAPFTCPVCLPPGDMICIMRRPFCPIVACWPATVSGICRTTGCSRRSQFSRRPPACRPGADEPHRSNNCEDIWFPEAPYTGCRPSGAPNDCQYQCISVSYGQMPDARASVGDEGAGQPGHRDLHSIRSGARMNWFSTAAVRLPLNGRDHRAREGI